MPSNRVRSRPVPRKARKATYAGLKRKLDAVFSEWVRWSNPAKCVTCGAAHHRKRLQAGHFVSRVHLATRWDERNVHPQCMACNVWKRGSPAEFSVFLTTKYGPNILQELVDLKHTSVKWSRSELEEKIEGYKARLARLGNSP